MILGWLFLCEELSLRTLVAATVILASVVLISIPRRDRTREPTAGPSPRRSPRTALLSVDRRAAC
jgi:hypothetical protein